VLSDATVDGMPGTDFVIDLHANRFKMSARFLTDLASSDSLAVKATLDTRRFYGYSEHKLPIYEEDNQKEALLLGFDEQIILLPFGRNGGDSLLKIEITPSKNEKLLASEKAGTPEINIIDPGPGFISIRASRTPHNFDVSARLLENGREIARRTTNCLIEEPQEVTLQSEEGAAQEFENPLTVRFTIDKWESNESKGQASITFDAYELDKKNSTRQPVALNWSGIIALDKEAIYDLTNFYLKGSDKKYELRFIVSLSKN